MSRRQAVNHVRLRRINFGDAQLPARRRRRPASRAARWVRAAVAQGGDRRIRPAPLRHLCDHRRVENSGAVALQPPTSQLSPSATWIFRHVRRSIARRRRPSRGSRATSSTSSATRGATRPPSACPSSPSSRRARARRGRTTASEGLPEGRGRAPGRGMGKYTWGPEREEAREAGARALKPQAQPQEAAAGVWAT